MTDTRIDASGQPASASRDGKKQASLIERINSVIGSRLGQALLYGLRFTASVSFALYVAFWLELEEPSWAATSAAIVCLPGYGPSLRKSLFRTIGTLIGVAMAVILAASFPQDRMMFFFFLATWAAISAMATTIFRNFAAYAAALSGYTVVIIAGISLGAHGGINPQSFFVLLTERTSEVLIGIFCAGLVRALTDAGGARNKLETELAGIIARLASGLHFSLTSVGQAKEDSRQQRHESIGRVIALDALIDETIGETSTLNLNLPVFRHTVEGLFHTLGHWRALDAALHQAPAEQSRGAVDRVAACVPQRLREILPYIDAQTVRSSPGLIHRHCQIAIRDLVNLQATTPAERTLADHTAQVLHGIANAISGVEFLQTGQTSDSVPEYRRIRFPDFMPGLINALRAFVVVSLLAVFWVVTAWPHGVAALALGMVMCLLLSQHPDKAKMGAIAICMGIATALVLITLLRALVLPFLPEHYSSLVFFIALYGMPIASLAVYTRRPAVSALCMALLLMFGTLAQFKNPMSYDYVQYFNLALAYCVGAIFGACAFMIIPPLGPERRGARLVRLSLRDLEKYLNGRFPEAWFATMVARFITFPDGGDDARRAELLAIVTVGEEANSLRYYADWLDQTQQCQRALDDISTKRIESAIDHLIDLREKLMNLPLSQTSLRARGCVAVLIDVLSDHKACFQGKT